MSFFIYARALRRLPFFKHQPTCSLTRLHFAQPAELCHNAAPSRTCCYLDCSLPLIRYASPLWEWREGGGRAAGGHVQWAAHPQNRPAPRRTPRSGPDTHYPRLVTLPIQRRLITDHTRGTR
ncbi:hypothetical protein E2C01_014999 [Portunus trituberculatus]|uniref:Uncharacterized protein n=1 Tax=Portunus trituberculatus TaxID=210409 RepID=A0A5B7DLZ3_PORTR|nr:hypothetical protein [Portunus trituberculatus]